MTFDLTQVGDATFHLTGEDLAAESAEGRRYGVLSGVLLHTADPSGQCEYEMVGSADAYIDESSQQLVIEENGDGSLVATNVALGGDCFGVIGEGGAVELQAAYNLVSPHGSIAID